MSDPVGPGSLKLVTAGSQLRDLGEVIEQELTLRTGANDVRRLADDAFALHTNASVAEVRDWLVPHLCAGESLFVVEFERWSAGGAAADQAWLLRRGH